MEKRLVLFLILSAAIFFTWSRFFLPKPTPNGQNGQTSPAATSPATQTGATPSDSLARQDAQPAATPQPAATQVALTPIKLKTDSWFATLSNQGGVIEDWTMTRFTDGSAIDAPTGVNLVSPKLSQEIGAPFRFLIPSDPNLEKELNSARYEIKSGAEREVFLGGGQRKDVTFNYSNNGVEANKNFLFKGAGYEGSSGFEFDFTATVKRNGNPVEAFVVIGPNFGDQSVTQTSTYKHAPQLTYAVGTSVEREPASSLKGVPSQPTAAPIDWAAVDDNYFALAFVPPRPAPAVRLLNSDKVSIGVGLAQGEVNHVYAGAKDLELLSRLSGRFGLEKGESRLDHIVSYGWLNKLRIIVKPIAQFMLKALRAINTATHNFGWSIVVLTVLLNMIFFPLRWRSSVSMRRAAAMQPKMKDLQERMKKLEKNDPRMLELQKEQIALMKEGNPLMGCLPLLLQMPFFMAVFAILTVSIEVRHAPFFGWIHDLSSKDPYFVLPILMCISMILQTALTPTTVDPVQKKVQYLMPVILTVAFFASAPAGLVLYWMVSNLVGVGQQYVINKLNPPPPPAVAPPDESKNPRKTNQPQKNKKAKEALAN